MAINNNLPTLRNEGGLSAYLDQIKKTISSRQNYWIYSSYKG